MAEAFLGYHMAHKHGKFSGEKFSTTADNLTGSTLYVVSNPNIKNAIYYLEGKYQIEGLAANSDSRYDNKNTYKLKLLVSAATLPNLNLVKEFDKEAFHNNFTSGQPVKKINGTQGYLIELFNSLLDTESKAHDLSLIDDLSDIDAANLELSETERLELKLARIGQGEFRKNTIKFWGGDEKCAVTGLRIPALLNASHITPWKECKSRPSERKNGSNGVMLCVHLDRLFDRFLIGFQKTNKPDVRSLVYSPKIKDSFSSLKEIGIDKTLVLDLKMVKFAEKHLLEQNLDKHLARVLEEL